MKASEYLDSLIAGQTISSIPVQLSELTFLKSLLKQELDKSQTYSIKHKPQAKGKS